MMSEYMIKRQRLKNGTVAPAEKKKPQPPARRSGKMKDEMKEYKPKVKAFLAKPENQFCHIKSPVCKGKATCVNHRKRRGSNLLKEEYWEPSCTPCNGYIEENVQWALDNGHLISVHKK